MRLYAAVAALTFAGSLGTYTVLQMTGAAGAIGGASGRSAGFFAINPLALLQPGRLRSLASRDIGIAISEPVRSPFDAGAVRGLQPKVNFDAGRTTWSGPQPYRPPIVHATPSFRPYR